MQHNATQCNTQQHTVTYCDTMQHTAIDLAIHPRLLTLRGVVHQMCQVHIHFARLILASTSNRGNFSKVSSTIMCYSKSNRALTYENFDNHLRPRIPAASGGGACGHPYAFFRCQVRLTRRGSAEAAGVSCLCVCVCVCVCVSIISGSFAKNDLQLKASFESLSPCTQSQRTSSL